MSYSYILNKRKEKEENSSKQNVETRQRRSGRSPAIDGQLNKMERKEKDIYSIVILYLSCTTTAEKCEKTKEKHKLPKK